MTIEDWITEWLDLITPIRSPRTIAAYKYALKHCNKELLRCDVCESCRLPWQRAVYEVAGALPRQAQLMHAALRAAWRTGQKMQVIPADNNPWQYINVPTYQRKTILYLKPDEMSSYCRAARQTKAPLPLMLMLLCGLRRGEVLGLKWSQIDRREMVIHINMQIVNGVESKPKSRASVRNVPICAEILHIIDEYGDKTSCFVYNSGVGRLYAAHEEALRHAQLPNGITLHGLRHSCATAAIAAGVTVSAVQHLLGHSHFSTTADIYAHALIEPQREAVEKLTTLAI